MFFHSNFQKHLKEINKREIVVFEPLHELDDYEITDSATFSKTERIMQEFWTNYKSAICHLKNIIEKYKIYLY